MGGVRVSVDEPPRPTTRPGARTTICSRLERKFRGGLAEEHESRIAKVRGGQGARPDRSRWGTRIRKGEGTERRKPEMEKTEGKRNEEQEIGRPFLPCR